MPGVEGAGVELAYAETGSGPAVLLVHGMAADHAVWPALGDDVRAVAYDRRGYGGSGAPEPYTATTIAEQAEDAAALAAALGLEGVVACGEDVGALVVLDLVRRHPGLVRAAVLVDPPLVAFVADANEGLAGERAALEDALRDGGAPAGAEAWLALRGVDDPERIRRARRDAAACFADYGGQTTLELTRRDLRALELALVVLDGARPPSHVRAASDALVALAPQARRGSADELVAAVRGLALGA